MCKSLLVYDPSIPVCISLFRSASSYVGYDLPVLVTISLCRSTFISLTIPRFNLTTFLELCIQNLSRAIHVGWYILFNFTCIYYTILKSKYGCVIEDGLQVSCSAFPLFLYMYVSECIRVIEEAFACCYSLPHNFLNTFLNMNANRYHKNQSIYSMFTSISLCLYREN